MSEYLNLSNYPKDWEHKEGISFLTLGSGVSPSNIAFSRNGDTPYMKVDDFNNPGNSTFIKKTKLRFDKEDNKTPLARELSIIIAKRGAAIFKNRVRISQYEMAVDTNLMTIDVNEEHCPVYFKFLLEFINLGSIADTTSIPQLNNFHLNETSFAFPPLPEQKKIAAILTSVDEVIEKTKAQIDKLKDLKTGMMQELLTRGVGVDGKPHTEFKDSPVGRIPKGWEVKSIIQVLERVIDYRGKSPPKSDSGLPLLTAKNIRKGFINPEPKEFIPFEKYEEWMVRGVPTYGDVFITTEAPLGNVARVPKYKFAIGQRVLALCPKGDLLDTDFLVFVLQSESFVKQLVLQSTGSTVAGIKQSTFKNILLPVPSLGEQVYIAGCLKSNVKKCEGLEVKLTKLKDIKKALMQDLLTGKKRVKVGS
ncbi:restriction endonuclease subunit S [Vibrio sp. 10N.222.49.B4]|uniref:restriction endonuclease subunit S n=1 Tax=Vibrio sp. 10N.222.49.B4 TaxID=3229613 RepID=UPI003552A49F